MGQGPLTATRLVQIWAEVIRVKTEATRPIRCVPTKNSGESTFGVGLSRVSYIWALSATTAGKRGITLNLKSEKGREILYALVKQCDVFLQKFGRSGWLLSWGSITRQSDRTTLKSSIWKALHSGARVQTVMAAGIDAMGAGFSGLMHLAAFEGEEPRYPAGGLGDAAGALMGLSAIWRDR